MVAKTDRGTQLRPAGRSGRVSSSGHHSHESVELNILKKMAESWSRRKHGFQAVTSNRNVSDLFAGKWLRAPATKKFQAVSGRRSR